MITLGKLVALGVGVFFLIVFGVMWKGATQRRRFKRERRHWLRKALEIVGKTDPEPNRLTNMYQEGFKYYADGMNVVHRELQNNKTVEMFGADGTVLHIQLQPGGTIAEGGPLEDDELAEVKRLFALMEEKEKKR